MTQEPRLTDIHELGLIERIAGIAGKSDVIAGIGDDAAVLPGVDPHEYLLATADALVEHEHFEMGSVEPNALGRRTIAVNVSDVAAMGGRPLHALSSIAVPERLPLGWIEEVYQGMHLEADRYGVDIVGGNVARIQGPIVLDVTMLGAVDRRHVLLRSGAKVGDFLAVTGLLGGAYALRLASARSARIGQEDRDTLVRDFAVPVPPVEAAQALARSGLVHAALDLSDGLGSDIRRLGAASRVGALLYASRLPVPALVSALAETLGVAAADMAMFGGEDYQLLLALPREAVQKAASLAAPTKLTPIGDVIPPEDGYVLQTADGTRKPLPEGGWRHF